MQKLQYIDVELIDPHPDNPRKELGDLTELADSIRANGVMQNLTVIKQVDDNGKWNGRYTAVIGHRRLAASKLAEVKAVPCVIAEMDHKTQVSTMLLENMQRSDLTAFEEAQGFQMMLDLGESVASVSERTGFSETKVRRRVEWTKLDQKLLKEVSQERQISITDLDKLAQIEDVSERNAALEKIGTRDYEWEVNRRVRAQKCAKNEPLIMQKIKELGYTVLPPNERYSSKYEQLGSQIDFCDWTENTEFPLVSGKQKVFYDVPSYGKYVKFYVLKKKAEPVRKSEEELNAERQLQQQWDRADELLKMTFSLRLSFVRDVRVRPKNMGEMLKAAAIACALESIVYTGSNRDLAKEAFRIDKNDYSSGREGKAIQMLNSSESAKLIPITILAALGDSETLSYIEGYRKAEYPKHHKNAQLDVIYDWLCSLGYEMSTEEQQLRDGTHSIFKQEESQNDEA